MKCAELTKISELVDGELDRREATRLDAHLASCSTCKSEVERLLSLSQMVQNTPVIMAPPSLDARMMAAFREHHKPVSIFSKLRGMRLTIPIPVFAAILLLAAGGILGAFTLGSMNASTIVVHAEPDSIADRPGKMEISQMPAEPAIYQPKTETRIVTRIVNVCSAKEPRPGSNRFPSLIVPPKPTLPTLTATVNKDGYFTDLKLDGFQPPETLNAQIIKGVK